MNITFQRCHETNLRHMLFAVQYCLIEMGDTPALRNRVLKKLCQLLRSRSRNVIAPCTEGRQQFSRFIKGHITMHHRADANGSDGRKRNLILLLDISGKVAVAGLQPRPDILQTVCPDVVLIPVLPIMAAAGQGNTLIIRQNRLDTR